MSEPCRDAFEKWMGNHRTHPTRPANQWRLWKAGWNSRPASDVPSGWISVTERLPEEGNNITWFFLVYTDDEEQPIHVSYRKQWSMGRIWDIEQGGFSVTHWQPLPTPPAHLTERNG